MNKRKRLVFLDFDGVLNYNEFLVKVFQSWDERKIQSPDDGEMIDPGAVQLMERICSEGNASVVISSSWRLLNKMEELEGWLRAKGLKAAVVGKTGYLGGKPRGLEIQKYLDEHPGVESFVILDDGSDMEHLIGRLVQTSLDTGLLESQVAQAVALLNKPLS